MFYILVWLGGNDVIVVAEFKLPLEQVFQWHA